MPDDKETVSVPESTSGWTAEENAFLLKRAFQKILTFVSTMTIAVLIVILRQGEKLFLFNMETNNMNDGTLFRIFRILLLGFLIYLLGYLLFFWREYSRRKLLSQEEQMATLPTFRKRYNLFDLWTVVPVFLMGLVIITGFFYSPAVVEGASMQPTYYDGDAVIIDHFAADFKAGDVVIVDIGTELLIKRLIAVSGDHLRIDEAGVYLNGGAEPIEDYIPVHYDPESSGYVPYFTFEGVLSEGQYFIMGDNRENSLDSRVFGLVESEQMLGVVVYPSGD